MVPLLVQRVVGTKVSEETRELAASVGVRISVLYSLIIGVMVANIASEYSDDVRRTYAEAVEIVRTDETLRSLDTAQAQAARHALRAYVQSLIEEEWGQLHDGNFDPVTRGMFRNFQQVVHALKSEARDASGVYDLVQEHVSQLSEYRAHRFLVSNARGTSFIWLLGIVGFTALLVQFGFYSRSRSAYFLVSIFSIMQATVFFVALVASSPFSEPGAISPQPLAQAIEFMDEYIHH